MQLSSDPQSAARCPACDSALSTREYARALKQLERIQEKRLLQQRQQDVKAFQRAISGLKTAQLKQLRMILDNEKKRHRLVQKQFEQKTKAEKRRFDQETRELKIKYNMRIEQTREFYSSQNEKLLGDVKADYENRLVGLLRRYEDLVENVARQQALQTNSGRPPGEEVRNHAGQPGSAAAQEVTADRKSLELQRLRELQLISQMIKEMAQERRAKI